MWQTVGHRLGLGVTLRRLEKDTLKIVGQLPTWILTLWLPWLLNPQSFGNHEIRNLELQGFFKIGSCSFFYGLFLIMKQFWCVLCFKMFDFKSSNCISSFYYILFLKLYKFQILVLDMPERMNQIELNLNYFFFTETKTKPKFKRNQVNSNWINRI